MNRYRPLPEIDGPIITQNDARLYRWPFFAFEGGRWTYRRFGIGRPVTVTEDEVVQSCRQLQKYMRFVGGFFFLLILGITSPHAEVIFERTGDLAHFVLPAIIFLLGPVIAIVRLLFAAIQFRRFDRRPRFGAEIGITDRLAELMRIHFWSRVLAPGQDIWAIFVLLSLTLAGWFYWGNPALIVGMGLSLAVGLTLFTHRFETIRRQQISAIEDRHEESDQRLTAAMEETD